MNSNKNDLLLDMLSLGCSASVLRGACVHCRFSCAAPGAAVCAVQVPESTNDSVLKHTLFSVHCRATTRRCRRRARRGARGGPRRCLPTVAAPATPCGRSRLQPSQTVREVSDLGCELTSLLPCLLSVRADLGGAAPRSSAAVLLCMSESRATPFAVLQE